jgi:hypothetical protein
MKPLFSQKEFDESKSSDKLPCECYLCKNVFYRKKKEIKNSFSEKTKNPIKYCSLSCSAQSKGNTRFDTNCKNCGNLITKKLNLCRKSKNYFCNRSCSGTYNNKHKLFGIRRSKLEFWLEEQLNQLYPNLEIHYNRKDTINSELDIYIPSLKLAFELNGIFHYEPIYGSDKLEKTKLNDTNKFQQCQINNISLCVIDVSSLKHFKPLKVKVYLDIIINIISKNLDI